MAIWNWIPFTLLLLHIIVYVIQFIFYFLLRKFRKILHEILFEQLIWYSVDYSNICSSIWRLSSDPLQLWLLVLNWIVIANEQLLALMGLAFALFRNMICVLYWNSMKSEITTFTGWSQFYSNLNIWLKNIILSVSILGSVSIQIILDIRIPFISNYNWKMLINDFDVQLHFTTLN